MKRNLIILGLCLFALSCSKSDDSPNNSNSINPPNWIQGVWEAETSNNNKSGFQFTANDIIIISGSSRVSHKEQNEFYSNSEASISVDEVITDTDYNIDFSYPQGMAQEYSFSKVDSQTIHWNNSNFGSVTLYKQ